MSYLKGAPEVLLARCALTDDDRESWREKAEAYAHEGFRVLALAWAPGRPRSASRCWVSCCSGIRRGPRCPTRSRTRRPPACASSMITGDHPATALAIAHQIGIPGARVLTGEELDERHERRRWPTRSAT